MKSTISALGGHAQHCGSSCGCHGICQGPEQADLTRPVAGDLEKESVRRGVAVKKLVDKVARRRAVSSAGGVYGRATEYLVSRSGGAL